MKFANGSLEDSDINTVTAIMYDAVMMTGTVIKYGVGTGIEMGMIDHGETGTRNGKIWGDLRSWGDGDRRDREWG